MQLQRQPLGHLGGGGDDADLGGNGIGDGQRGRIAGDPLIAGRYLGLADFEWFGQAFLIDGGNAGVGTAPGGQSRDVFRGVIAIGCNSRILGADAKRGAGIGFGPGLGACGVGRDIDLGQRLGAWIGGLTSSSPSSTTTE
ncbi:hypothetical protein D3C85_776380 [compost metagenome]